MRRCGGLSLARVARGAGQQQQAAARRGEGRGGGGGEASRLSQQGEEKSRKQTNTRVLFKNKHPDLAFSVR